ncbi:RHS repeat domain-containing protein [Chitiniphilus eburneus]|uniref:RHS repeat-associated core domain-containing protein n=1 Tax=Chitiniphilus eburneus TaxID=2571148 RepID=A0A4V5MQU2_9NEIS|nr:RHS repeat-associated core domain-containing protein [Chitiniphilus eburneus]TJZ73888.1 RHS repeat-associated core domain-containing protein [Chitiniphilus eburneus]
MWRHGRCKLKHNLLLVSCLRYRLQYHYDVAGNVVNVGANVYNNAGRIQRSKSGTVWWDYRYNALGQRVKKTDNASNTTLFIYDQQGQLQGEYDSTGQARLDTIWLENIPVAVVQAATPAPKLYYAWSDHLGTPRQLSNPADNKIVWEWAISEPFGHSTANADPDGDGQQLVYNLRFPGQYFDAETGRYYNYFRDYDPRIGRYIQSDPIGLAGGINTYGYVGGGPTGYIDPYGLDAIPWRAALPAAGTVAAVDGPFPFGDIVAVGILGAVAIYNVTQGDPQKANCPPVPDAVPGNLCEQLALAEAKAGAGTEVMSNLEDEPRLKAHYGNGPWVKKRHVKIAQGGKELLFITSIASLRELMLN